MVGVFNKLTGKMSLHDSRFFHLQPKVPGTWTSIKAVSVS